MLCVCKKGIVACVQDRVEEGRPARLAEKMNEVTEQLLTFMQQGQSVVLATIIRVQGSAYRREGAKMLIIGDDQFFGTLSAGCLEGDILYRAKNLFRESGARLHTYHLASETDEGWGMGSGCNGVIDVLLERIDWFEETPESQVWSRMISEVGRGRAVHFVRRMEVPAHTVIDELGISIHMSTIMLDADEQTQGSLGEVALDQEWEQRLLRFAEFKEKSHMEVAPESMYFLDHLAPQSVAYVFGAGPDARPLVALLAQVGFRVTVVDPRSAYLQPHFFPQATELLELQPSVAEGHLTLKEDSYAFIMTHSFKWDVDWVRFLRKQRPAYLGILGPRTRTQRLFAPDSVPGYVRSPIGVAIAAEGPNEIAVSIVAQVVQHRRNAD